MSERRDFAIGTKQKNEKYYSIAVDGPSGSGKSSLAKNLSSKLKFIYIDTGALYRSVALFLYRKNIKSDDAESIKAYLDTNIIKLELKYVENVQRVFLNGEDISEAIRENEISKCASDISKIPEVRQFLLDIQKSKAENNNVIMDGRDIGTVILPNADLKIFLTASLEERAKRRYQELKEKNGNNDSVAYEKVLEDMRMRDIQDSSRDIAPLKVADDAVLLDNSEFSDSYETLCHVLNIIKERLPDVNIY